MSVTRSMLHRSVGIPFSRVAGLRFSTAGVVRIVKSADAIDVKENMFSIGKVGTPLMNRGPIDAERAERVAIDVRVADLFRQYQISPSKLTLMSVLDNLTLMNINSTVLTKFPGFIQLLDDLTRKMKGCELTVDEFVKVAEILSKMRLKPRGENSGINADEVSAGFSNQLIAALDTVSKVDLTKTLLRIQKHMQLELDAYFYWALNKEVDRWASDKSVSDEEYIRSVMGPLQVFAQEPLLEKVPSVFVNPSIEGRIIDLIKSNKLNNLQVLELVTNLKHTKFTQMIQVAISYVVTGYKDRLAASISDLAVLISALPSDGVAREKTLQGQLAELVLGHLQAKTSDPKELKYLLEAVAGIVVDPLIETESEILELSAPLVLDNLIVVNKIDPNRVADLLYSYATGSLSSGSQSLREQFLMVCSQIESVVVGRMPQLESGQLAKLSLAFGSGILSNTNSFKALGATIRNKASQFSPHHFADAIYGLAYRGILAKSTLVAGSVDAVAASVPTASLSKLAWSVAVTDYSVGSLWESLVERIEKEILLKPSVLESLSKQDEAMLYEILVFAKVNNLGRISKNAERRIAQFESSWTAPVVRSEENYAELLENIQISAEFDLNQNFSMLKLPVYLSEFRLVIDATVSPVAGAGLTHGSVKLRHALWAKMGYNVIALADAQFSQCNSFAEKAQALGAIVSQFVSEVEATKSPLAADKAARPAVWSSRVPRDARKKEHGEWKSRSSNRTAGTTDWSSRVE